MLAPGPHRDPYHYPHFTDKEKLSTEWGLRFGLTYGVTNSPDLPGMRDFLRCGTFSAETGTVLGKMGWLVVLLPESTFSQEALQCTAHTQSLRGGRGWLLPSSRGELPLTRTHPILPQS